MNQTETSSEVEVDLLQLARALWKKAAIIAVAALVLGAAAFGYTKLFVPKQYRAQATMYVYNQTDTQAPQTSVNQNDLSTSYRLVATYEVFLQSRSTLEEVIRQTGLPYEYETLKKMVRAEGVENTGAFYVVVTCSNPQEAALIANTISTVLPEQISGFIPGSSVKIVDPAVTPTRAVAPSAGKNAVLGVILGILISSAAVVVLELTDSKVHTSEELTQTYGMPVLAMIPDLVTSQDSGGYYRKPEPSRNAEKGGKRHG